MRFTDEKAVDENFPNSSSRFMNLQETAASFPPTFFELAAADSLRTLLSPAVQHLLNV